MPELLNEERKNPQVAKSDIVKSKKPLKVLVVGDGQAALSAARYLSMWGHDVTLAEASEYLGRLARLAPTLG